jgi:hypothetical protein
LGIGVSMPIPRLVLQTGFVSSSRLKIVRGKSILLWPLVERQKPEVRFNTLDRGVRLELYRQTTQWLKPVVVQTPVLWPVLRLFAIT